MGEREFEDLDLNYSRFLPANPDAAILDVGCGSGRVLTFLHARGYRNLEGFDRDPQAVEAARDRTSARVTIGEDWESILAIRLSTFDLIILKDVLYYLSREHVVTALAAVRRALKPGGRIIVEVFNGVTATGPFVAYKDEKILWIPTEHTIRRFIERASFAEVSLLAQRAPARGVRRRLFNLAGTVWRGALRSVYFAERGFAEENPRIFTTKIIATACRPAGEPQDPL